MRSRQATSLPLPSLLSLEVKGFWLFAQRQTCGKWVINYGNPGELHEWRDVEEVVWDHLRGH